MWAIRILNGPQAGQVFPLKPGRNTLGRAPSCEVRFNSNSLSREHASIYITDDKAILTDLNSRNGSFLNGVKIQNQKINLGDKMMFQDILTDLIQIPDSFSAHINGGKSLKTSSGGAIMPPAPAWAGSAAMRYQQEYSPQNSQLSQVGIAMAQAPGPSAEIPRPDFIGQPGMGQSAVHQLQARLVNYIDTVAMPGIYHFAKTMPFFQSIAILMSIYIVLVTALSIVPMMSATKSSILIESKRRAMTIARNIAALNRQAILDKNELAINIRSAELEEGVVLASLVNAEDGTVISPLSERGRIARDGFVTKARRDQKEIEDISSSLIKVAVPIVYYNEKISSQGIAAFAIVHYDTSTVAMNSIDGFVLFVKTFAMASVLGLLLFFLVRRMFEHPLHQLNADLDDALRNGSNDIKPLFQFEALQALVSNINTALGRVTTPDAAASSVGMVYNRDTEAANVVRIMQTSALAINALDNRIVATNSGFDQLAGGGQSLAGKMLREIPDAALLANLTDLIPRMKDRSSEISMSEIPFFGDRYEICGQAIMGTTDPAWYLITLTKIENG
jgi:pSer/pThr/pTyr-binding forkhead associated (FHA) protein